VSNSLSLCYSNSLIINTNERTIETSKPFTDFNLNEKLIGSLKALGFENASPIQELTIPIILADKDIFAQAETGSGKTGAFAIPVLEQILRKDNDEIYIVLSPTRELAQQTHKVFSDFGEPLGIHSVSVIGGESAEKQKESIAKGARIIVGTPGRICDLIKQKVIKAKDCNCVIFDEADRLFEMGFNKDNEFVLRSVKESRQLIMVSATNNQEIFRTAYKFGSLPEEVKLNEDSLTVDNINQQVAMISEEEKMPYLVNLLRKNDDNYAIIFCNTQYMTSLVAIWLGQMDFKVEPISGRLPQSKRTRLLQDFRDKKINILVCTDVAARGLDIKDVNLVVNWDMPHEAPNYVHRIGRTGRAGKSGLAVGFCGYEDSENFEAITQYIGMQIPKADIEDSDFATDIVKRPRIDSKTLQPYESRKTKEKPRERTMDKKTSRTDKPRTDKPRTERKREDAPAKEVKIYERWYKVSSYSLEEAKEKAMEYFYINEESILDHEVIGKGKKKFIIFGPSKTEYKFKVQPIYRKILLPFLIKLFKKMDLKVYVDVTYRDPNVSVTFSGDDAGELMKQKFALHNAIKDLSTQYLRNKVSMASNTKISWRTEDGDKPKSDRKRPANNRRERNPNMEAQLNKIAETVINEVKEKKAAVLTKKLNPAERRIIHQYVEKEGDFTSTSVGDGRFKQIQIDFTANS
jgi:superfamily II DNA/RNA helicase